MQRVKGFVEAMKGKALNREVFFVILSEAKNPWFTYAHPPQADGQRCFALLNMTEGALDAFTL